MKIAIVVQGRFHAFDLGRALLERGHDVTVFTNYPAWAVKRFGFPRKSVRSFWLHGVLVRAVASIRRRLPVPKLEEAFHRAFGRWARDRLKEESWDVVHSWSGVSEELLWERLPGDPVIYLMRGSAHILTQSRLLGEEEVRANSPQDKPSPWMVDRELREYALAPGIMVLSSFSLQSFRDQGIVDDKLRLLPLGANLGTFRPSIDLVRARVTRILDQDSRLRILFVGTISYQKGLLDLVTMTKVLDNDHFDFQFVGSRPAESSSICTEFPSRVVLTPRVPQSDLPSLYCWGDVFVYPTIQDGYPLVLAQAAASALPILTTTNGSGRDLVRESENGWIVPIRQPDLIVERLRWCESHRTELADMVERIYKNFRPRDWGDVARDFERMALADLKSKTSGPTGEPNRGRPLDG